MTSERKIATFAGMPVDVTNDGPAMPEDLEGGFLEKARPNGQRATATVIANAA